MGNLFAFRATDPRVMQDAMASGFDVIGPDNDKYLAEMAEQCGLSIAAWGAHKMVVGRGQQVAQTIPRLQCLGVTKHGYPRHPLYLRADTKPEVFWASAK